MPVQVRPRVPIGEKMKDRFDLEHEICRCNSVVEDLDTMYEAVLDNPKFEMPAETADRIANMLLGLKELYEMRFDRLDDTFKQVFKLDQYHEEEYTESGFRKEYAGPDT